MMRLKLSSSLSSLLREQARWRRKFADAVKQPAPGKPVRSAGLRVSRTHLTEVAAFGTNPGRLRMLEYVPNGIAKGAPLVVVLHGCLQTAEQYDRGSGWTRLARDHGFMVVFPEQRSENNHNLCFNWFRPSSVARDRGELMSIRQMIDHASERHGIDTDRIYVHGLSAGAAMASSLLVTYPEVFAAGQLIAGLPFGVARDAMSALSVMKSGPRHSTDDLAAAARLVSPDVKSWPSISIWHGVSDGVVAPQNAIANLNQWLHLHGLEETAARPVKENGSLLTRWRGKDNRIRVEFRLIEGLDHGLPIKSLKRPVKKGQPYMLEAPLGAANEFVREFVKKPAVAAF